MNTKVMQTPPNNPSAEQAVLGAILNPETGLAAFKNVIPILDSSDFYSTKRSDIFKTCQELHKQNKPLDMILAEGYIKTNFKNPDEIVDEIESICQALDFITPNNVIHYAYAVKEKSLRRKTIRKLGQLHSESDNEGIELDSIFDDILELEREIKILNNDGSDKRKVETAVDFLKRPKAQTPYIVEGLLPASGFTSIAGFTGMGKSSLTMQLMLSILSGTKFINQFNISPSEYHILYINLENSEYSIDRLLKAQLEGIDIEDSCLSRLFLPTCMAMSFDSKGDVNLITDWIKEFHIEIIVIDPLLDSFTGDQNDLTVARSLIKKFREINCEISWILLHHFKKGGDDDDLIQLMLGSVGFANAMTTILGLRRFSRSVNPQYKKIEFAKTRDSVTPAPVQVCMNNQTRLFEVVAGDMPKKPISIDVVIDILTENGSMKYTDLATEIEFSHGIPERSAKNMIQNALRLHKINANNGIYSIADQGFFPRGTTL